MDLDQIEEAASRWNWSWGRRKWARVDETRNDCFDGNCEVIEVASSQEGVCVTNCSLFVDVETEGKWMEVI